MTDIQAMPLDSISLPLQGRHLIEASAGTGKTFNITRLFLRLLLEKELPVENILVMTFTRAATAELKSRLSREVQQAHDGWGQLEGDFYEHLQQQLPANRARALLHQALLFMDEAAIYTIHSFCKRALTQQAFASGISFDADLDSDTSQLMMEALEDWYRTESRNTDFDQLQGFYATPEVFARTWGMAIQSSEPLPEPNTPDMHQAWEDFRLAWSSERESFYTLNVKNRRKESTRAHWQWLCDQLSELASAPWLGELPGVLTDPELHRDALGTAKKKDALPGLQAFLGTIKHYEKAREAHWVRKGILYARDHLRRNKDRLDQLDFNDLITLLRERLEDPEAGSVLAANLLEQFPAALVDEFQDTDPDQYAILRAIYSQGEHFLCMIGDPKQAIYGFRGGDVFAYLKARRDAQYQWVMDSNFRSAGGVIQGYNRLFHGAPLSSEQGGDVFGFGIRYTPVRTGKPHLSGLNDPAGRADFQWGLLPAPTNDKGQPAPYNREEGMRTLAAWSAGEIRRLLAEATIDRDDGHGEQALSPGDVAILVRQKDQADVMREALADEGLNSVYRSARENVLESREAMSLLQALQGILDLEDDRALLAALATPWFGYDSASLFELQQSAHEWARTLNSIANLRRRWHSQGFMSMALQLLQQHARPDPQRHERHLTNSLHLLELIQQASQKHHQPRELLHWFQQAIRDSGRGSDADQLRLENDANLIQVLTLHGAKGLEYPVVFLPFISYGKQKGNRPLLVRYHEREHYDAIQALNPDDQQLEYHQQEQRAEEKRLLYVGATRGERRVYLLAAAFRQFDTSPLASCLGTGEFDGLSANLEEQQREGVCGVVDLAAEPPSSVPLDDSEEAELPHPPEFSGHIERDWWLSSFSALTRNARHGGLSSPERDQEQNEEDTEADPDQSLRFTLPKGAESGNLLHDVLEWLDFRNPDFETVLNRAADRYPQLMTPMDERKPALESWLREILETRLPSGACLQDLPLEDTLRESEFYFPMAAQKRGELGRILARHRGMERVNLPEPPKLKGMLHGYVDLIYHWQGRFHVADYKSNFMGDRLSDYSGSRLTESVRDSYYDLQYLLYSLALHRYLRTRLADYSPEQHLGGVEYLYLRGMAPWAEGGIYHRPADTEAVLALDALFSGQEASV